MNANELADLIGLCGDGGYNQDAAPMLRQQQAKIDTYRLQNSSQIDTHKYKPVAWMMKSNDPDYVSDYIMFKTPERKDKISHQAIPLYTHPAKEHFEDEPQAEELHEILQSNTHPAKTPTDEEIKEYYESTHKTYAQYEGFVEGVKWASKITKVLNVPVKTLENEEFIKLAEESGFMLVSSHPQDMENALYECFPDQINYFARSLLRKAQER